MERIRLYNDDCLNTFKLIEDKTIDLILIDPPYNIGKDKWDKWATVELYVEFMGKVFKECERVLKDNGSFYFFHNDFLQIVELQNWINKNSNFIFKQLLVWDKFNNSKWNQLNAMVYSKENRNYPKQAEYCLYYTLQNETGLSKILDLCFKPYLNYMTDEKERINWNIKDFNNYLNYKAIASHWFWQDKEKTKQSQPRFISKQDYLKLQETGYFQKPYEELRQEYEELRQEYEKLRYTFNNQGIPSVLQHEAIQQNGHITPKPIEILKCIIKTSSNENDIVLDCFMGSGSTGVACANTNRRFIGIEKEERYFSIAKERIEKASNISFF